MTFNEDIFKNINELINNLPFDVYKENKELIFDIINGVSDLLKDNTDLRCDNELLTSYADINEDLYNLDIVDSNLNEYDSPYGEKIAIQQDEDFDDDDDIDDDIDDDDFESIHIIEDDDDCCDSLKRGTVSFHKTEPITEDNVNFNVEPTILKNLLEFTCCNYENELNESDFLEVTVLDDHRPGNTYVMTKYINKGHTYCNSNPVAYYRIVEIPDLVSNGRHRYSISGPQLDDRYESIMCEVYELASRDEISYSLNYQLTFKNF